MAALLDRARCSKARLLRRSTDRSPNRLDRVTTPSAHRELALRERDGIPIRGLVPIQKMGRIRKRSGQATMDYFLTMGIILPLAAFLFWACPIIMNLVYEMTCVVVSWPFQ